MTLRNTPCRNPPCLSHFQGFSIDGDKGKRDKKRHRIMPNFVFWNLGRKLLAKSVGQLARESNADVLILAETPERPNRIIDNLRQYDGDFSIDNITPSRRGISLYYRGYTISRLKDARFWTVYLMDLDEDPIIVVAVHMPAKFSRGYTETSSRLFRFQELNQEIIKTEEEFETNRTIVIGDFNQNPFDEEMIHLNSLNAVMDPDIASQISCEREEQSFKYFYNPMWSIYGRTKPPFGTYFYRESEYVRYYWHVIDQVLLRPDLIPSLGNIPPKIVTEVGGKSILKSNGRPDKNRFSDHLPILMELDI